MTNNFLIDDEKIKKLGLVTYDEKGDIADADISGIAQAELKHIVKLLESETIKAWGGNRVLLNETWLKLQEAVKK